MSKWSVIGAGVAGLPPRNVDDLSTLEVQGALLRPLRKDAA
ncbi:hypothetical protein [Ruegeria arenilitoris]|nr:hypothetical protein [Ruegeria arenilitoris]